MVQKTADAGNRIVHVHYLSQPRVSPLTGGNPGGGGGGGPGGWPPGGTVGGG